MKLSAFFALALASSTLSAAHACSIPYSSSGTVAATSTIKATATGDIDGYFVGYNAGDTDGRYDNRLHERLLLREQDDDCRQRSRFGSGNAGDTIVFKLYNETTGLLFASSPTLSADGINHVYTTAFGGGTLDGITYAAGNYTYVGMEDLSKSVSDLDYNDDQFLFTDVSASATPEPEQPAFAWDRCTGSGLLASPPAHLLGHQTALIIPMNNVRTSRA